MPTFFDIVQNPNMSRPNAGVSQNAIPPKRRVYRGGYGKGNKRTEARSTNQQQSQQKSLPSTQGFTGQPNINLSNNFYFGNDDLIQNRGLLNVMNSKTANANLIPQNLNPVSENYFPKFEEIKQQLNQINQVQQSSQRHILDNIKPQFEDMKGLIQENRKQINNLKTQVSQNFDPKIQENIIGQINKLQNQLTEDIQDVKFFTEQVNRQQLEEVQSRLDEYHQNLTDHITESRNQLYDREVLETVKTFSTDLQSLKQQSDTIGQMSAGLITQLNENRNMISDIQNKQMTTTESVFTSLQEHRQEQKELGELVRLSLMNDKNKNPVYNQIRVGLNLPEVALGRPPRAIKNEDVDAEPLPVTQFSQRPQQPVLEDNYDVGIARQMLDTLEAQSKAKSSASSEPVSQLEYTQPLLLTNASEMPSASIDTRPPTPVPEVALTPVPEVEMRDGRTLDNPDTSLEREQKKSK